MNTDDQDRSLGDAATFAGRVSRPRADASLGDERTLGGGDAAAIDTVFDDIEVIDLAARYKTEGTLGRGGMGEVLLALDTRLDRKVAIKRILGEAARSKTAVSRFLTEAKAIAALNHPNVVQIYDYGRAADGPFLIMEYVDGSSLLDRCRDGALPLEQAVDLACQLCDGLAKAHDLGIVHRDIKPANVLLTKDGLPKLTDFGLAKAEAADHQMTMTGAVLGTPDFMPPEQRKDAALVDHRSDLWSLAATLYQMVTGRSPKIIRFDLLPSGLTGVLGKALEESKDDRYQSAREFRDALKTSLVASAPAAAELGEGQCPACGVKNDSSRRFCRGCGESLEAPCLSCSKPMPMWEHICGQCGTKQSPLLEDRSGEMAARQAEAEGLLKDYDFDQAERLTVSLRDESDPRLKQLVPWATDFVAKIGKAREAQLAQASARLAEALKHEASFDYPSAIHALEQVAEILRSRSLVGHAQSVAAALSRVTAKQSDAETLESLIKARITSRDLSRLLPEVEKLHALRPDRADVEKLRAQLTEREQKLAAQRDEAVRLARGHLDAKDYESAIAVLRKVDRSVETPDVSQLRDAAEINIKGLQNLLREISQAVAQKQFDGLMNKVQAALALKPGHAELTKLLDSLQVRESKVAAGIQELLSQADTAFKACQFAKAAALLQRVPEDRRNSEVTDLLDRCEYLAMTRAGVLAGFEELPKISDLALDDGVNLKALAAQGRSYLGEIATHGLSELLIEQWCGRCETAHETREAAAEEARRAAATLRRVFIGVGAAAAAVLLAAVGLWARSSWRAATIETALARSDWQAALTLDPDNIAAIIGQAKAKLSGNPADIDGAFAALDRAEKLAPGRGDIRAVRGAAYATRAIAHANSDRLTEAAKDIAEATRATAEPNLLRTAKDVIAAAWLTRVVEHGNAGRMSDADAALKQAERYANDESALIAGKAVIATAWLNHAAEEAKGGRLGEAEKDLAEARRYGADEPMTRPLFEIVAAAWTNKAKAAIEAKKSADALAAISSARKFGAEEQTVSPLVAEAMILDAAEQYSRGELSSAASTVVNALNVNATVVQTTLTLPENLALRQAMIADCRSKFDAARSGSDWEGAVRIATAVARLEAKEAGWVETVISELPPEFIAELPAVTLNTLPAAMIRKLPALRNSIGIELKLLPAGTFTMGAGGPEGPHKVTLSKPFYMGVYEVTNKHFERVMGSVPSKWKDKDLPVESVTWNEADEFCRRLSELPDEQAAGRSYRLPTNAEWEYACRAGSSEEYAFGRVESTGGGVTKDTYDTQISPHGWDSNNSGSKTHPVGKKLPNSWGLHDMHGNVSEWCDEWFGKYPAGDTTDPRGPPNGEGRVIRGGDWNENFGAWRSAYRVWGDSRTKAPALGFRVALSLSQRQRESPTTPAGQ
jgi:serine/threonine protein kinase/formylglycine-generating enzyme required for sulfatase activity